MANSCFLPNTATRLKAALVIASIGLCYDHTQLDHLQQLKSTLYHLVQLLTVPTVSQEDQYSELEVVTVSSTCNDLDTQSRDQKYKMINMFPVNQTLQLFT